MAKIGRNSPCPCGSGIKYKRCHGNRLQDDSAGLWDPNHRKAVLDRMLSASNSEAAYAENHGHGKGIITTRFGEEDEWRAIAVGNEIFVDRADVAKYFTDFLAVYGIRCLGDEWMHSELDKPFDVQHQAAQWLSKLIDQVDVIPRQANGATDPTGYMLSWLRLGYDLYQIQHNSKLQDNISRRLRDPKQFQGARFELLCTATLIAAGYEIEFEDEDDSTRKHPEFVAVHKETGLRIAIEAKSKHRPGVLGFTGEGQPAPKGGASVIGAKSLLLNALKKTPMEPYFIFFDLNLPDLVHNVEHTPLISEMDKIVEDLESRFDTGSFPANEIFFVNDVSYRYPDSTVPGTSLWAYSRHCKIPRYPIDIKSVPTEIAQGLLRRTKIPAKFPVDST